MTETNRGAHLQGTRNVRWLVTAVLLGTGACAVETGDESVVTTTAPFTMAECGYWIDGDPIQTLNENSYFYGPGVNGPQAENLPIVTPTTYSNAHCWRGFVVSAMLTVADATLDTGGGQPAKVTISWNDALPSNKADCNNTYIMAIGYTFKYYEPDRGFHVTGEPTSSGVWYGWPLNRCIIRPVVLDSATYLQPLDAVELSNRTSYRFAITGRAPNAATRSLRLTYDPPQIIR